MKTVRIISMLTLAMALTGAMPAQAQQKQTDFAPQWYVLPQVGLGYHVGEASFGDLLSPAFQLGVGYRFTPLFGLRASMSGFQARNWQCHPVEEYKWNYMQGNIDAALSVTDLIWGWDTDRRWNAHALAGIGLNLSFKNDDANALAATPTAPGEPNAGFEELWSGKKAFFAMRLGAGVEYSLNERLALGLEYVANALPDQWNSKRGKNGNMDWQQNLLAGVRIALGPTRSGAGAGAGSASAMSASSSASSRRRAVGNGTGDVEEVLPPDVFAKVTFAPGSSDVPDKELSKLQAALDKLRQSPESHMTLSGYEAVDQPVTYSSLSKKRAEAIKEWLVQHGADASRIDAAGKGMKMDGSKTDTRSVEVRIE